MKKIVVSGERFFMKYDNYLNYFRKRAKEVEVEILLLRSGNEREVQKSVKIVNGKQMHRQFFEYH